MILPLWDQNPFEKEWKPYVSWAFIAINIVIFFASGVAASGANDALPPFAAKWALVPATLFHPPTGTGIAPFLTLFTSMFLHADWLHLIGNMWFMWVFADDVEEALGRGRFLLFYLSSGVLGQLAYAACAPNATVPELGASGALAGVLAAYAMYQPCQPIATVFIWVVTRVDAIWVILGWVALQIVEGLLDGGDDGIAYAAHLGGLLGGALLFYLLRPRGIELFQCPQPPSDPSDPPKRGFFGVDDVPDSYGRAATER